MADENVGSAWYELGARDEGKLRRALGEAEGEIKRSGQNAERLFATPMERATGRVADGVDDIALALNSLSGRSPKELADQLNRAEREAEEALAAIKQISQNDDLSPKDAQRYADALNEIQVEADQTVADLRQLQQADPRFDTDELNRAAQLIDKVGDEAKGTAGELERLSKGNTHLEGVSREARHAARDLGKAEGSAGRFGGSLGKLKGIIVGLGVAFGLREAIGKMNEAVEAASGLEEAGSKVDVVFGDMTDDVRAWSRDSATAFGQSQRSALEAAGTYGNLLQAFGVARPAAAEMSKTLVELAADLASFNNTGVDEALDALRSGLSGETEPLKRYGVALNDARLKEEALRMGLIETASGTLPIAVKAQAAYALILKDTALAQGDFARTSDGLANQQRILAAETENMAAEIGQELIPLWKQFIGFMRDPGIPIIKSVVGVISDTAAGIGEFVDNVSDDVRWLQIYFGDLGKTIEDRANEIGADVGAMKDDVLFAMNDLGLGIDEAMTYAEQRLDGLPMHMTDVGRRSLAAWKQEDLGGAVADSMVDAAAGVEGSGLGEAIGDEVEEGATEAIAIARALPGQIADAIIAGEAELDPIKELIDNILAGSVSDAAATAENAATLVNPGISKGLTSNSQETRDAMLYDVVEPLIHSMNTLDPAALLTGEGIPKNLRQGVFDQRDLAIDEVTRLRDDIAPEMDLAEFARQHGLNGIAALIEGMEAQEENAKRVAGIIASRAANELDASDTAWAGGYATGAGFMNGITAAFWAKNPEVVTALNYMRMQLGGSLPEIGPLKGDTAARGGDSVGSD